MVDEVIIISNDDLARLPDNNARSNFDINNSQRDTHTIDQKVSLVYSRELEILKTQLNILDLGVQNDESGDLTVAANNGIVHIMQTVLSASKNWPEEERIGEIAIPMQFAVDIAKRIVSKHLDTSDMSGSWAGIINDFLGLLGFDGTHSYVYLAYGLAGSFRDVFNSRDEAVEFLVNIGVPAKEIEITLNYIDNSI
jgi:hypothetical protein